MRIIRDNEIENSLISEYHGDLTIEKLAQDVEYDLNLLSRKDFALILVNLTDAKMHFGPGDLNPVTKRVQSFTEHYKSIKVALIVDLPIPTANMLMLGMNLSKGSVQYRVFSSVAAGLSWLGIELDS